jgi:hypothetical protein
MSTVSFWPVTLRRPVGDYLLFGGSAFFFSTFRVRSRTASTATTITSVQREGTNKRVQEV